MNEVREVIIVGGGPAGYTAAVYLARAKLAPLMLNSQSCQLMLTSEVENFPGFKDGVSGVDLMMSMRQQAEKFGTEILDREVTRVDFSGEIKKVYVGEEEYLARAVIIATGARPRVLKVGEKEFIGKGVSTCAVCDAAFFKNKRTMVVGGGDAAMEDALALAKFATSVDIVHRRGSLRASKIMQERVMKNDAINLILDSEVIEVSGSEKLETVKIKSVKNGKTLEMKMDGLFLAIGHTPTTDILKGQVELDPHGYLVTKMTSNKSQINQRVWIESYPTQTNIEGVFGAGDVVDFRYRQAVTAAGMGAQAALDAEKFLTGRLRVY